MAIYRWCIYFLILLLHDCESAVFGRSSEERRQCPVLFMCPSFCMQVRDGCYVCDCGSMSGYLQRASNELGRLSAQRVVQTGTQMGSFMAGSQAGLMQTQNLAGAYYSKGHIGQTYRFPLFSHSLFGQTLGEFGGRIQAGQSPNYFQHQRPPSNNLPDQQKLFMPGMSCTYITSGCSPACLQTDIYTGCIICSCDTEQTKSTSTESTTPADVITTDLTPTVANIPTHQRFTIKIPSTPSSQIITQQTRYKVPTSPPTRMTQETTLVTYYPRITMKTPTTPDVGDFRFRSSSTTPHLLNITSHRFEQNLSKVFDIFYIRPSKTPLFASSLKQAVNIPVSRNEFGNYTSSLILQSTKDPLRNNNFDVTRRANEFSLVNLSFPLGLIATKNMDKSQAAYYLKQQSSGSAETLDLSTTPSKMPLTITATTLMNYFRGNTSFSNFNSFRDFLSNGERNQNNKLNFGSVQSNNEKHGAHSDMSDIQNAGSRNRSFDTETKPTLTNTNFNISANKIHISASAATGLLPGIFEMHSAKEEFINIKNASKNLIGLFENVKSGMDALYSLTQTDSHTQGKVSTLPPRFGTASLNLQPQYRGGNIFMSVAGDAHSIEENTAGGHTGESLMSSCPELNPACPLQCVTIDENACQICVCWF